MRRKNIIMVLLIIAVAVASSIYAYEQMATAPPRQIARNITTSITTARYIMFGGNYEVIQSNDNSKIESGVFKLDTYTGKAWVLKSSFIDGEKDQEWIPVFHKKELKEKTGIPHSPIRGLPSD